MSRIPVPLRVAVYHALRPEPMGRLARYAYRRTAARVARRLTRIEGAEIALRAHCLENPVPGFSDLDFLVKLPLPPTTLGRTRLREVRRIYRGLARRWPVLGEVTWLDDRLEAALRRFSPGLRLLYGDRYRFDGGGWTFLPAPPDPPPPGNRFALAFSAYRLALRYGALSRGPGWGTHALYAHRMRRAFAKAIAFAEGRGVPAPGEGPEPGFANAFFALDRLARQAGPGPRKPSAPPSPLTLAAEHAARIIHRQLSPRWPLLRQGGALVGEPSERAGALFSDWLDAVAQRSWTRQHPPVLVSSAMARRTVPDRAERILHLAATLGSDLIHGSPALIRRTRGSLAAEGVRGAGVLGTLAAAFAAVEALHGD